MNTIRFIERAHTRWSSATLPVLGLTPPGWADADHPGNGPFRQSRLRLLPSARLRHGLGWVLLAATLALTGAGSHLRAGTFWDENDYIIADGQYLLVLNEDFTYKASLEFPVGGFWSGSLDWLPNGDLVAAARGNFFSALYYTCDSNGNLSALQSRQTGSFGVYEFKAGPNGTDFFISGFNPSRTVRTGPGGPVGAWGPIGIIHQAVDNDPFSMANAVVKRSAGSHELWIANGCDLGGIWVYPLAADGSIVTSQVNAIGFPSAVNVMTFDPAGRHILFPKINLCDQWHSLQRSLYAIHTETRTLDRLYSIPDGQIPSGTRVTLAGETVAAGPGVWFAGVTAGENGRVAAVESWAGYIVNQDWTPGRIGISVWNADGTGYQFVDLENVPASRPVPRNSVSTLQNIVWTGNSPAFRNTIPAIQCPAAVTFDCTPAAGLPLEITAFVTDVDSGQSLTVSLTVGANVFQRTLAAPVSDAEVTFGGVVLAPGAHTLTLEVSDGQAVTSCQFNLQLNPFSPPTVVSSPADATIECPAAPAFGTPEFSSACDASLTVTAQDEALPVSGKEISKTRRTWTATDDLGQSISTSQTITVVDTTAPTFDSVPSDITAAATSAAGATVTYPAATASDTCSAMTISYSQPSGTVFPVGTTTVVVTATDAVGNQATASFTVTVTPFVLRGDLDGNGCVDLADLTILAKALRHRSTDPRFDLNGDGRVNIADARWLVLRFTNPGGRPCAP